MIRWCRYSGVETKQLRSLFFFGATANVNSLRTHREIVFASHKHANENGSTDVVRDFDDGCIFAGDEIQLLANPRVLIRKLIRFVHRCHSRIGAVKLGSTRWIERKSPARTRQFHNRLAVQRTVKLDLDFVTRKRGLGCRNLNGLWVRNFQQRIAQQIE